MGWPPPEDAQAAIDHRSSEAGFLENRRSQGVASRTDEPLVTSGNSIAVSVGAQGVAQFIDLDDHFQKHALIDQALREDGAFEGGLVTNYVTSCVVQLAVIEGQKDPRVQIAWRG